MAPGTVIGGRELVYATVLARPDRRARALRRARFKPKKRPSCDRNLTIMGP